MPQPNALDLVRMILASGGDQDQMTQLAAMRGNSAPWAQGRGVPGGGLDFIDPEGRRLPAEHPYWRDPPQGTRDDPWGLDAWSDHRERQTGKRIPRTWRGEESGGAYGFASGGAVPNLLLQSEALGAGNDVPFPQYVDWYQRMYGPQTGSSSDAADPQTGLPGLLAMAQWLNPDGVGSTATNTGSSPQTGVNSTSNSPTMAAVNAAIGAVSPVPGLTSIANMAANALASLSSIGVPGVATNATSVPGLSIGDTLANMATQTANAVAAGVGTGNNAGQPGQANQPGQAPNVGPTPGIGMAQQTAQQANVGGGAPGNGSTAAPSDPTADSGTDSGAWARGGYLGSLPTHLRDRMRPPSMEGDMARGKGYAGGGEVGRRGIMKLLGGAAAGPSVEKVAPKVKSKRGNWVDFDKVPVDDLKAWWKEDLPNLRGNLEDALSYGADQEDDVVQRLLKMLPEEMEEKQLREAAKDYFYTRRLEEPMATLHDNYDEFEQAYPDSRERLLDLFGDYRQAQPKGWNPGQIAPENSPFKDLYQQLDPIFMEHGNGDYNPILPEALRLPKAPPPPEPWSRPMSPEERQQLAPSVGSLYRGEVEAQPTNVAEAMRVLRSKPNSAPLGRIPNSMDRDELINMLKRLSPPPELPPINKARGGQVDPTPYRKSSHRPIRRAALGHL